MKLCSIAILLGAVVAVSDAGAQEPRSTTEADVTPDLRTAPAPRTITATRALAPAPWQHIEPDKRQYYVYRRYVPGDLAAQIDRPVTDSAYRELLARRAASFQSGARRLRLAIDQNTIIDLGAARPDDANTIALVDLAKSPDLRATVLRDLKVDETESYVVPFLSTAAVKDGGAAGRYRSHDSLIVSVAARDHSRVAVWRLADGRWQRVSEVTAAAATTRDPRTLLNRLQLQRERVYYGGFMRVSEAEVSIQQTSVAPVSTQQMITAMQARLAEASAAKAEAEGKPAPTLTTETEEETEAPAQPASFTAYGQTPFCSRHCSAGSCSGCCNGVRIGVEAHIGAIAFACHTLSDLCPWCHAGCAANTAMLLATSMTQFMSCTTSCNRPFEVLASQGNPRHCPVD